MRYFICFQLNESMVGIPWEPGYPWDMLEFVKNSYTWKKRI